MKGLVLVPLLACGLLAGCVTENYAYRNGDRDRGDYYYGNPGADYHYIYGGYGGYGYPYGGYGGYGYPYGGYGRGYWSFGYHGGGPYYGYPYRYPYTYPHHYSRPRPPRVVVPGPDGNPPQRPSGDNGDRPPPWRDLNNRGRPHEAPRMSVPDRPQPTMSRDSGPGERERPMRREAPRSAVSDER